VRALADRKLWDHVSIENENSDIWMYDPPLPNAIVRLFSFRHEQHLRFNMGTLHLLDGACPAKDTGLSLASCLPHVRTLDCFFPLPQNSALMPLLASLKPRIIRVACNTGAIPRELDLRFLSSDTAVYFTNPWRNNTKGQPSKILGPVSAKRHVLNWWYTTTATHVESAVNIIEGGDDMAEFVLILRGKHTRFPQQAGSRVSRGLLVAADAVLRRPHIHFTLVGLESWCRKHSPTQEFLERLVGRRRSPLRHLSKPPTLYAVTGVQLDRLHIPMGRV
jgi:hypothetical protein